MHAHVDTPLQAIEVRGAGDQRFYLGDLIGRARRPSDDAPLAVAVLTLLIHHAEAILALDRALRLAHHAHLHVAQLLQRVLVHAHAVR